MTQVSDRLETIPSRWSSGRAEDEIVVYDPATGRRISTVPGAGIDEVDLAVRAAYEGHRSWRRRTPRERGRLLVRAAQLIAEHADEVAALESQEMGKPVTQARQADMEACITLFHYFGGLAEAPPSQVREQGWALDLTLLEPYGVIAGIIPFNWPPLHTAGKAAPALALGNAIVLKPPEQAPLAVMRVAELVQSVLPDDVLHVVPGGRETGAALVGHPLIGKITFTGSSATGRKVMHAAADNLTPTLMELGGKNPLIVFEDADLDSALEGALDGGFFNQGEACTATSRVLVQRSVHDTLVDRLGPAVARLRVGDGADTRTHIGPMVTKAQQQRVLAYIDEGLSEGARIAAQAPLPEDPALSDGFYVPPTVFVDVTADMRIAQEEIFGPVVCVMAFDDEHDAIEIANGTPYGLVAAVYSQDAERTLRVSRQIDAGIVFVNNFSRPFFGTPFGGTGASGFGRVHAPETLREFGWSKSIRLPSGFGPIPGWQAVGEVLQ